MIIWGTTLFFVSLALGTRAQNATSTCESSGNIYGYSLLHNNETDTIHFADFVGKAVVIVNTASFWSKCSYCSYSNRKYSKFCIGHPLLKTRPKEHIQKFVNYLLMFSFVRNTQLYFYDYKVPIVQAPLDNITCSRPLRNKYPMVSFNLRFHGYPTQILFFYTPFFSRNHQWRTYCFLVIYVLLMIFHHPIFERDVICRGWAFHWIIICLCK